MRETAQLILDDIPPLQLTAKTAALQANRSITITFEHDKTRRKNDTAEVMNIFW
jgi:hypothetical protein